MYYIKLLCLTLILLSNLLCFAEDNFVHKYSVINLDDTIQPVSAGFLEKKIKEINKQKQCFLIIISLNTPGGLLASTEDITSEIIKSEIPISVYVSKTGGKAASAGFFILISSDYPAMAPATNTGAAHPVSGMPSFLTKQIDDKSKDKNLNKSPEKEKALEYASAFIRSLAEKRGRSIEYAEKAVRESKAYTAKESLKYGLIDYIESNEQALAKKIGEEKLNLKGEFVVEKIYEYSFREKLLSMLASPQIVYLLFLAGVIGVFIEIKSPGVIFPGLFGALCLILFFYATKTIPINFAGALFIILAIILFLLEFKVVSYGFLTIGGIVSMIIGSAMLIDSDLPGFSLSISQLIWFSLILSAFMIFIIRLIVKTQFKPDESGLDSFIGKIGKTVTKIDKEGKMFFNGEYWNVYSDDIIKKGKKVIIVEKDDNMNLKVKEKED